MPEQPLVSIIIPTYNRAQLIGETLDSVLAQTYQNWECIVVDDGSTDNTVEVLKAYIDNDSRFQYHRRTDEHLPGGNGARNYGFKLSKGDYIQWFDSDDVMTSDCLEKKLKMFDDNCQFVISEGAYLFENGNTKNFGVKVNSNLYKDYVTWKTSIFTPSILFKKSFIEASKVFFNELLHKGQETEFLATLFYENQDAKFKILHEETFYYRRHSLTKSAESENYIPRFKWSNAYNHLSNLKRCIELKDEELITYFFKKCLKLYYSAVKHQDKKTYQFVFKELKNMLFLNKLTVLLKLKALRYLNKRMADKLFNHLRCVKVI
ncbi:glycosyltransferase family 2 protein [Flavobacteriaceae bacterium GSB9]|nr:glycosyltransferase family 2 protein [Flavobacteriaceae bacterium GSB9]